MNAGGVPKLVDEAVARVVAAEPPARRGSSVLEVLRALPGAHPLGQLGVRCFEYEIRIGLFGHLAAEQQKLAELAEFELVCKPDFISCTSLSQEEGDAVLVLRYSACKGETLIPLPEWKDPLRTSAGVRLRSELQQLAAQGKVHPYVRGSVHWLVSGETGTLLLERWSAVRDASESDRVEALEAVDEILVERGEASTRNQSKWSSPASSTKAIPEVFGQRRVLFPVVHPVTPRRAKENVLMALEAGCKGIFLINQGMTTDQVLDLTMDIRRDHPTLWVGLNLLGTRPTQVLRRGMEALEGRVDGIWVDNAGVDKAPVELAEAEAFVAVRRELNWNGLYFGGVAFKYQPEVAAERLPEVCVTADRFMDVVTTSGVGTGEVASVSKVQAMRASLGESASLALASGIDAENVADYLPYVDAYLVSSSLEHEFGVFDPERVQFLQARIKNSRWT